MSFPAEEYVGKPLEQLIEELNPQKPPPYPVHFNVPNTTFDVIPGKSVDVGIRESVDQSDACRVDSYASRLDRVRKPRVEIHRWGKESNVYNSRDDDYGGLLDLAAPDDWCDLGPVTSFKKIPDRWKSWLRWIPFLSWFMKGRPDPRFEVVQPEAVAISPQIDLGTLSPAHLNVTTTFSVTPRETSLTRGLPASVQHLDATTTLADGHPDISAADVTLHEYLGGGAQGAVYTGRVNSTGLMVAVKVIHNNGDAAALQARREATIARRLKHPNIVRVFEARQTGDYWVVIMELLQGTVLDGIQFTEEQSMQIAEQLASAIQTMAHTSIVHRDIKPANIILRAGDKKPVIIDFGLALELDGLPSNSVPSLGGTPLYMPPEAFAGQHPEPSWDAYALGITILALMNRQLLPSVSSFTELAHQKVAGQFENQLRDVIRNIQNDILRQWTTGLVKSSVARRIILEHMCPHQTAKSNQFE